MSIVLSSSLSAHNESIGGLTWTLKTRKTAIAVYNMEIQQSEDSYSSGIYSIPIQKFLSMHVQRADLYFANKNYQAALKDYQKVVSYIEDGHLFEPADFLEGICGCLFCYLCLEKDELAKREFDKLIYHVALIGDEVETIGWFKNGPVYPFYKKKYNNSQETPQLVDLPELTTEEFCGEQCTGYALAASFACARVPNVAIAALCAGCIWGLQQLCARCCKGVGFWENCVKPLRRLYHDPEHPKNPAPHPFE
jgi:hypothetical protein